MTLWVRYSWIPAMVKMNRRELLKSSSIGLVATSIVPTVSFAKGGNEEAHDDPYYQALYLRNKHSWSIKEFREYLAKRGFEFQFKDETRSTQWPPRKGSKEKDVNTQELSEARLDLRMTYTRASAKFGTPPKIDFDWYWRIPKVYEEPRAEDPYDVVEIEWQSDESDPEGAPYGGDYVYEPENAPSHKTAGIAMRYDDVAHAEEASQNTDDSEDYFQFRSHTGVDLNYQDGDPGDRDFYVRYYHTFENVDVDMSFTLGAPSASFSNDEKSWLADAMATQAEMDDGDSAFFDCGSGEC